jgi:hypothetical protein
MVKTHKTQKQEASEDEPVPLTPEQQALVGRVRKLMLLSGAATLLGIAVVIGVIGYRVFRTDGSVAPAETITLLPKGAKIVSTATAGDRLLVTVDINGALEIRSFDAHTLKPAGRLKFATEP